MLKFISKINPFCAFVKYPRSRLRRLQSQGCERSAKGLYGYLYDDIKDESYLLKQYKDLMTWEVEAIKNGEIVQLSWLKYVHPISPSHCCQSCLGNAISYFHSLESGWNWDKALDTIHAEKLSDKEHSLEVDRIGYTLIGDQYVSQRL